MDFITIPAQTHELGWNFDDAISDDVRQSIEGFMPFRVFKRRFSAHRHLDLPEFSLSRSSIGAEELLDELSDAELEAIHSIVELCDALDAQLATRGLRVPTADELEAACGGGLFPWGNEIPDGIPSGTKTTFTGHKQPNQFDLILGDDPYKPEIARATFMLGDGGEAICGDYPWPMAWLSLSPCYRVDREVAEEYLVEYLEDARVRPVRLQ